MREIILKDKLYGTSHFAYPVGTYLCAVAMEDGTYKIFRTKQRTPFIGTPFKTLDECLGAINVFYEIYGEYFPIWENKEWEDADVPSMLRYTVKNGINLYEFIRKAEEDGCVVKCSSLYQFA